MSLRCGCAAEGDAIVFGEIHECSKNPDLRNPKSRGISPLVPSWAFVVPERPYERVLGEDETHD
jgi:hypothetical protein